MIRVVVVMVVLCAAAVWAAPPVLRWGADAQGGAPAVFQDPTDPNRLVGFEVELATLVAAELGRRPLAVQGPWDKLLELLARGDFDCVINGIERVDEKRRVARFSRTYFVAPEVLTVRKGDPSAPRSRAALRGKRIGTLVGVVAEHIAEAAGAEVKTYEGGQDELYADLVLGRLDGVLLDAPVAHFYGDLEPSLEAVPGDFGQVEYVIAVRPEDEALLTQLDAALLRLEQTGALRRLYERWGVWNVATAAKFHDEVGPSAPAEEFERWRIAVGKAPPFLERVTTRYPAMFPALLRGAAVTLAVSVLAMLLAVLWGSLLALGRRFGPLPLRLASVAYIELFRGTPLLIQLIVIYFGLPQVGVRLDPLVAGVLALGLNYAAAEAENYRAGLEAVPRGQSEAAEVLGLTRFQTLRYVVVPQALRVALPPMTNDFIALLKDSSLVSVVTLTELTKTYGNLANASRDHLGLGLLVALMYLLLGLPFARLARAAERHFARHLRRGPA